MAVTAAQAARTGGGELPVRLYQAAGTEPVATLVRAHGAGAPQAHPFMVQAAEQLASRPLAVVTFDFPYKAEGRKLPDKAPVLEQAYLDVIAWVRQREGLPRSLAIGGKSMGGRMASHVAAHHAAAAGRLCGLVFLGYPLHPPDKPAQRRDAHLPLIQAPMLFVQGSRDSFGTPDELRPVLASLAAEATLHVVEGGDHGFAVSKRTGAVAADVLDAVWDTVAGWVRSRA